MIRLQAEGTDKREHDFGPFLNSKEAIELMIDHTSTLYALANISAPLSGRLMLDECYLKDNILITLETKLIHEYKQNDNIR